MSRLVASEHGLRALVFLSQRPTGGRASEVAAALGISHTGARKALGILAADGLTTVSGQAHSIVESPRTKAAIDFGLAFLAPTASLAAIAQGNPAVEFAGIDDQGVLVVLRRFADPAWEGRLHEAIDALQRAVPELAVAMSTRDALREAPPTDQALRFRALDMRVLKGRLERTFADRVPRRSPRARTLGRVDATVRMPSGRRLRGLARRYGLRRILAFGSGTRTDFRPDSDIDLFVEPAAGRRLGLLERVHLVADAESLFDRDVDIVVGPVHREALANQIRREGVVLYDAAR